MWNWPITLGTFKTFWRHITCRSQDLHRNWQQWISKTSERGFISPPKPRALIPPRPGPFSASRFSLLLQRQKPFMQPNVIGQLRVKTRSNNLSLLYRNDHSLIFGQHFYRGANAGNDRCPDENPGYWLAQASYRHFIFKTVNLGAKGISLDRDVQYEII